MVQYIDAEKLKDNAIQKIVRDIKKQQFFAGNLKYTFVEGSHWVYTTCKIIPHNMLTGTKAKFLVHIKQGIDKDIVQRIYLVV